MDLTTSPLESLSHLAEKSPINWNLVLFSLEQNPITVKHLLLTLLSLFIGFKVAKYLSKKLAERVQKKRLLDKGAVATLQVLSFYFLFALVVLFSFYIGHIPLTFFTVFGGVLAIGLGFGSRNIINNFISGLILMFERPIKVEDFISVEGQQGFVEYIGARSTRIRTANNTYIIVPNSILLEKSVFNLSFHEYRIRTNVTATLSYQCDPQKIYRIFEQALREEQNVLQDPPPAIFFNEFGVNGMEFEALFWVKLADDISRKEIQSNLRLKLFKMFQASNIQIAYPQLDIHLEKT